MPKYYFNGFKEPAVSDVPLTEEEKSALSQRLGGAKLLRIEGLEKPGTPLRRAAEVVTKGTAQAFERMGIPSGEAVAPWIVPQTEAEMLGMAAAGPAGRYGAKILSRAPRLGSLLGQVVSGAGTGAIGAKVSGEPVGEEAATGAGRGVLGWLAGIAPGIWRRQMPGGPAKAGREMTPQVGAVMGQEVPEIAGAQTPLELHNMGRFSAGHAAGIKEAIEEMYGQMLERLAQGSGGQKILVPTLLNAKDQEIVTMALQAQAQTGAIGPQAARNLQQLRDRFGFTLGEVVNHLKARKAAFRTPSQTLAAQERRGSVSQIVNEVDDEIRQIGLPASLMQDYAEISGRYKSGKAFFDILNPESLYTSRLDILPHALQRQFGGLSSEESRPLVTRIGKQTHKKLSDILYRGAPAGTRDVPGFLPRMAHIVLGGKGTSAYLSSGGAAGEGVSIGSRYAAAPGRLPLESSKLWKDLMAVLAQKRLSSGEESPAIP